MDIDYAIGHILGALLAALFVILSALSLLANALTLPGRLYRLLSEWLAPPRQPSPQPAADEAALYNAHASQPRRANPNCRSVIVLKTDDDPPPFVVRAARHVPRPLETKDLS